MRGWVDQSAAYTGTVYDVGDGIQYTGNKKKTLAGTVHFSGGFFFFWIWPAKKRTDWYLDISTIITSGSCFVFGVPRISRLSICLIHAASHRHFTVQIFPFRLFDLWCLSRFCLPLADRSIRLMPMLFRCKPQRHLARQSYHSVKLSTFCSLVQLAVESYREVKLSGICVIVGSQCPKKKHEEELKW